MTLWSRALSVDELDSRLWVELMPWLDRYGSARTAALEALTSQKRWWETESPAETAEHSEIPELCAELAHIYVGDHPELRFADGLLREDEVPVAALDLGPAASTLVARLPHAPTTAELFTRSPADLLAVRGADRDAVEEIVCAALVATTLREPATLEADPRASKVPAAGLLLDDLAALARWHLLRGLEDAPLLHAEIGEGAPEEVQDAAARIRALTARDLPVPAPADPIAELVDYLQSLPPTERDALRRRVVGKVDDPGTPSTFPFGTAVGDLLAALRAEVRPVASFDRIVREHSVLTRTVPGLDAPLWKVLDRLDDRFEVADGWIAVPDLPDAEKQTRGLLSEFESPNGVVEPAAVKDVWSLPDGEFEEWMRYCGTTTFEGRVLTPADGLAGRAAQVLEVLGDPLSAEEIIARSGINADAHTLTAELADDERFVLDDDRWALATWAADPVTAVRNRIARLVDAQLGVAELDKVVAALVERFGISEDSARTFAAGGDFELVEGTVRRRRRTRVPVGAPERTRRLYRIGDAWRLRIPATRDHLRGAEFTVPSAVAALAGCAPGHHVVLASRLGGQTLRWTGAAPALSSIRRFLEDVGVEEGNELLLEIRADARFDVLPLRTVADNAEPLRKALSLIGHTEPETVPEDGIAAALASAIGLDGESRARRILSAYRGRREAEVVALLEQAWVRGAN
ncbi:hypothetical protein OED52_06190 [Rhodococcus sp. Z13]|uniref:Uncharacterized protein n=1 Tax=Rhodococcus sacchari TaxID=2962047 RepID=A0ACD4DJ90_9NOCA|nr:hypothetical protein [Rhodococcus sp. Z13]UYP20129.1 hypothetical protein OED52_06190 [Rhodococcus sp. Z13]